MSPLCFSCYILRTLCLSVLSIRRIVGRFEIYFHHTFAGPRFCCGLFGKWSECWCHTVVFSVIAHWSAVLPHSPSAPSLHVHVTHSPEILTLCDSPLFHQLSLSLSSGLPTPSLTTGLCCSLRSCFRRVVPVEVSHCSHNSGRPQTLKDKYMHFNRGHWGKRNYCSINYVFNPSGDNETGHI